MKVAITGIADNGMMYSRYSRPASVDSAATAGHSVAGDLSMFITRVCRLAIETPPECRTNVSVAETAHLVTGEPWECHAATVRPYCRGLL
jgi:hypothetical protein